MQFALVDNSVTVVTASDNINFGVKQVKDIVYTGITLVKERMPLPEFSNCRNLDQLRKKDMFKTLESKAVGE